MPTVARSELPRWLDCQETLISKWSLNDGMVGAEPPKWLKSLAGHADLPDVFRQRTKKSNREASLV